MNDIVQRETLSKRGFAGFVATVGGVGLLVMAVSNALGFLIGGVLAVCGLSVLLRKNHRPLGFAITSAGLLGILSGAVSGFPGSVLGLTGSGLIAYGGISIYRFFRGLKSRM